MNDVHFIDLNDPNNPCWYKMNIDDSNEMVPAPRWRHTATAISESEMLVLLSVHCLHICVASRCFGAHSLRTQKNVWQAQKNV
jgi:hypothetical protein